MIELERRGRLSWTLRLPGGRARRISPLAGAGGGARGAGSIRRGARHGPRPARAPATSRRRGRLAGGGGRRGGDSSCSRRSIRAAGAVAKRSLRRSRRAGRGGGEHRDGASRHQSSARVHGVPPIVIGGLVLAAVTSLPNAVAAVYLARRGSGTAVLSTALNSNALNVLRRAAPSRGDRRHWGRRRGADDVRRRQLSGDDAGRPGVAYVKRGLRRGAAR